TQKATRKVVFELDPNHGYGATERRDWDTGGHLIQRTVCTDWKLRGGPGLWLPNRCVAYCYARPPVFVDNFSSEPVHVVMIELQQLGVEPQKIGFSFALGDEEKPDSEPVDQGTVRGALGLKDLKASDESVDWPTVERIRTESVNHSQVMETVSWLTDVYGPRLTGSPNFKAACDWAVSALRSWG